MHHACPPVAIDTICLIPFPLLLLMQTQFHKYITFEMA